MYAHPIYRMRGAEMLRRELRLGVFENRVKRKQVRGGWRKLHNREHHDLCC